MLAAMAKLQKAQTAEQTKAQAELATAELEITKIKALVLGANPAAAGEIREVQQTKAPVMLPPREVL